MLDFSTLSFITLLESIKKFKIINHINKKREREIERERDFVIEILSFINSIIIF